MSASQDSPNTPADLSALQSLNIGPSWATSSEVPQPKVPRNFSSDERGERGRFDRRDRRPERRFNDGERRESRPRNDSAGNGTGANDTARPPRFGSERRSFGHRDGDRREFRPRLEFPENGTGNSRFAPPPQAVEVAFFPEEKPFEVLLSALRTSMRTYELFEIAHLILEKNDRFTIACRPLNSEEKKSENGEAQPAKKIYQSVPDQLPFLSENDAVAHVLKNHIALFFDTEQAAIDPPKGEFQVIARDRVSGELLAPPNYHGYQQILREHHAAHCPKVPFSRFLESVENVRDEAQVKLWLEKMSQTTRYILKDTPEGEEKKTFDTFADAKKFLLANRREKIVREAKQVRFSAKMLAKLPNGPLRAAIEFELGQQRRFPLIVANAMRARLKKSGFFLYKKGGKGITLLCSVPRKYRTQGAVFADSIQSVFDFIEKKPNTKITDLPKRFFATVEKMTPVEIAPEMAPPVEEKEMAPVVAEETPPPAEAVAEPVAEAPVVSDEKISDEENPVEMTPAEIAPEKTPVAEKTETDISNPAVLELLANVRWLVSEGYVVEYSDGRLFALPIMSEAQIRAAKERDEKTPEDTAKEMVAEILNEPEN